MCAARSQSLGFRLWRSTQTRLAQRSQLGKAFELFALTEKQAPCLLPSSHQQLSHILAHYSVSKACCGHPDTAPQTRSRQQQRAHKAGDVGPCSYVHTRAMQILRGLL